MIDYNVDKMERRIWLDSLDWKNRDTYMKNIFSEEDILFVKDRVNWLDVSIYQNFSKDFLREYGKNNLIVIKGHSF